MKYLLLLTLSVSLYGRQPATPTGYELNVYVSGAFTIPPQILSLAEWTSARMLSDAGVHVNWVHSDMPSGAPRAHNMFVVIKSGGRNEACVIAFAQPYEGRNITILYDRLRWAETNPRFAGILLAHTLTHEIAHNLQGIARHSETGIMKPFWTNSDYCRMIHRPLVFEPLDIELIQKGLENRD